MDVYARRRAIDGAAKWLITLGGIAIIVSILAMLVFLIAEVVPLWLPSDVEQSAELPAAGDGPAIASTNAYRELVFTVARNGVYRITDTRDGTSVTDTLDAFATAPITAAAPLGAGGLEWAAGTADGRVVHVTLHEGVRFESDGRSYAPEVRAAEGFRTPGGEAIAIVAGILQDRGLTCASVNTGGDVHLLRRTVRRSLVGADRIVDTVDPVPIEPPHVVTALAFGGGPRLYLGTELGALLDIPVAAGPDVEPEVHTVLRSDAITALGTLLGGQSLVVGGAAGQVEVWFRALVGDEEGAGTLQLIPAHTFPAHAGAVGGVSVSDRDKRFLTWDRTGQVRLAFSTTEVVLAEIDAPGGDPAVVSLAPRGDGVIVATSDGRVHRFGVDVPHPEVTVKSLFGKVHYEGYAEAEYVWQSTGATDETEAKLSLVPLIFGTLKGTFYALFISVPIGILAALYSALFMRPEIRDVVKPAMELMAALPSVVLGLLAGLWLAPRLQTAMPAALILPAVAVGVIMLGGAIWRWLPARVRRIGPQGIEAFVLIPILLGGVALVVALNPYFNALFESGFLSWLYQSFEIRYDQRNALVVGLAMGLAVIPIIYSISEDAISSVPRHLTAGSLALGATPWQTAWRVVLPAASPGIFSAVMIGFGRAVGETMIVLMATGNTPIMDWSIFNGFRTLSANIAVEIPEAPHGGTLYRVLFLAALLLFVITFLVNTAAELVRHRLRQRYSRF